jgi:hypothetical protein
MQHALIEGLAISVDGRTCRTARLSNEGFDFVDDPDRLGNAILASALRVDLLTFVQRIAEPEPKYAYHLEWDPLAVLPIESYEQWWKRQINDKTRNMIRKAKKKGVILRTVLLDDELVRKIKVIYDESPVRQGKPFKHFGRDFETLKRTHATYLDQSEFIGAFLEDQLVGFVKLVHQPGWSSLMQIISLISQRDKAPTNALIAKAVEICAQKRIPRLQYGIWSRRGIGDFKEHHGFHPYRVPRYYMPLSVTGKLAIASGLHRPLIARVPEDWLDRIASLRANWNSFRFRNRRQVRATPQSKGG